MKDIEIEVTIKLDRREAEWLKRFIQNPRDDDESTEDFDMREELFENLDKESKIW